MSTTTLRARICVPGATSKVSGGGCSSRAREEEEGQVLLLVRRRRALGFLKAAGSEQHSCDARRQAGIAAKPQVLGFPAEWKKAIGRGGGGGEGRDSGRRRLVVLGMVENKERMGRISTVGLEQGGKERLWHTLPSGLRLEVLLQGAAPAAAPGEEEHQLGHKRKPALVMVHGSYHAAWCWAVFWMDYFAARGYDCWAVSLLGQGGSDVPQQQDVAGHSFGGLIVQFYLSQLSAMLQSPNPSEQQQQQQPYPRIAGAILACSVPPTGNVDVMKRYLRSKPIASIKVTLSLAAKLFTSSVSLCRETFFSPSMDDAQVIKYQKLMKESSRIPLFNLRELNATLPIPPRPPSALCPLVLVVGAENDFVLDWQAVEETAAFYGTTPHHVPGVAHDMMLDICWKDAAQVLVGWLDQQCC